LDEYARRRTDRPVIPLEALRAGAEAFRRIEHDREPGVRWVVRTVRADTPKRQG